LLKIQYIHKTKRIQNIRYIHKTTNIPNTPKIKNSVTKIKSKDYHNNLHQKQKILSNNTQKQIIQTIQ